METQAEEQETTPVVEPNDLVKLKSYISKVHSTIDVVRRDNEFINTRLKEDMSRRDKSAYRSAYRKLSSLVRDLLKQLPIEPPHLTLLERPELASAASLIRGNQPIPVINHSGTIYMGCPKCNDWIDITKIFTNPSFDGVYRCPNKHFILIGSTASKN